MSAATDIPDLASAAERLTGGRFRLHGRDPETGLDCVGVVAAAMAAIGRSAPFPTGYALKRRDLDGLAQIVSRLGLTESAGPVRRGEVLLFRVGACQFHFGISAGGGAVVHAHAGLRRVIRGQPPADWLLCRKWQLANPA